MRLVEILLVTIALIGLVWGSWTLIAGALRDRRARWVVQVRSAGEGTRVQLEKPGEAPYVFRELPRDASDSEVEDALIEARSRAESFNALLGKGS